MVKKLLRRPKPDPTPPAPAPPPCPDEEPLISLLVPFFGDGPARVQVWEWLRTYWQSNLSNCEIVMGHDTKPERKLIRRGQTAFSKTTAVNDAFSRAKGDVIVILDADAYLDANVVQHCADRIRAAREAHVPMWFVPYRWHFRLTREATNEVLETDPHLPFDYPTPPPDWAVEGGEGSGWGHFFGALIQIMPREAFDLVGGMDPRFRGWGGEDVAFLHALDTLWAPHKNTDNEVLHLWHPKIEAADKWTDGRGKEWQVRMWKNQRSPRANDSLARRYNNAAGKPEQMRQLTDEGRNK